MLSHHLLCALCPAILNFSYCFLQPAMVIEIKYSGHIEEIFRIWQDSFVDWIERVRERQLLRMNSRIWFMQPAR